MERLEQVIAMAMTAAVDALEASGNPRVPDEMRGQIADELGNLWAGEIRRVVVETQREIGQKAAVDDLIEGLVRQFFEAYSRDIIDRIFGATSEQMIKLMVRGQKRGLTYPEIAREIRDVIPNLAQIRARMIVRTEMHGANMFASHEAARASRRPMMKEWISAEDHRTRDFGEGDGVIDEFNHRSMNGVQVPMDDVFLVPHKSGTKEAMAFPGDPAASAGNRINCRCTLAYVPMEV